MRKWLPLIAVSLGTFMLLIDVTIVVVALPAMAGHLHSSLSDLQWVLDGYALALAALVLGAGAAGDRFGRRRAYLIGLVVFALASLACAVAPGGGLLIAGRIVQGAGGAAMYAMTVALLNVAYQGRDRGVAFGVWGAVSGVASALGPLLGGLLTEHLSWRWIFLVNLPVSVVAVALTRYAVRESRGDGAARVDLPGMVTFTVAAGAVTYALIRANAHGWTSAGTLGLFAVGGAAFVSFVFIERSTRAPMLDPALLRRPAFLGVLVAALLTQAAAFGYLPYTSVWLQTVLGHGPVSAGVLGSLPLSLSAFVVAALAGRRLHHLPPRLTIGIGLLLIAAGDLLQAVVHAGSAASVLVPGLIVAGLGVGAAVPALAAAALASVPPQRAGMAGGAVNAFRQLGFTLGVAAFGAVFQSRLSAESVRVRAVTAASNVDRTGYASAVDATLIVAAAAGLVGALVLFTMLHSRQAAVPAGRGGA
jgi:EmrB/QacA subfamily drug resistance transporter